MTYKNPVSVKLKELLSKRGIDVETLVGICGIPEPDIRALLDEESDVDLVCLHDIVAYLGYDFDVQYKPLEETNI